MLHTRMPWSVAVVLIVAVPALALLFFSGGTVQVQAEPPTALPAVVPSVPPSTHTVVVVPPTPTAARVAQAAAPTPTTSASPQPSVVPTPSPRPAGTPWRVGLQVGHWRANELPEELARLRTSTGAVYGNLSEVQVNLDIAQRVKPLLEAEGVVVDLLPATVPPAYDADAFVALHIDGVQGAGKRGWKIATPWRASTASRQLLAAMAADYGKTTGIPEDAGGVTFNMRGYYAFSYRRHVHAIAPTTPAVILEMGFLTSAADRAVLLGEPDRIARGVAAGVMQYLRARDPNDGAALLPPEFPLLRVRSSGATLRAAPGDRARALATLTSEQRLMPFTKEEGWYEVIVRGGSRLVGWVREDQVEETNEPLVMPTPTNP